MRYCREKKAVFDNSRNRRRNFDDVGTEEENTSKTLLAVLRQVPRVVTDPRRHCRFSRSRENLQGGEAACWKSSGPPR
ncbi:hypothetical protein TNCV_696051 [Trichonephila clavipes]|nr:hypothetical protein TNCV_696051 [Trichonephila clavipes]